MVHKLLSSEEYIKELKLDDDQIDDINEELETAEKAWNTITTNNVITIDNDTDKHQLFSDLVIKLGTTYSSDDHGVELSDRINESYELTKDAFIDWYIRWVFQSDDDLNEDDNNINNDDSKEVSKSGWTGISWSIAPTSTAITGETWKCSNCRIINKWNDRKCLACDSNAPHIDDLPPEVIAPVTTNTGFTFGGPVSNNNVFSFGGQTTANTTTSSSNLFTTSSTGTFTFGTSTVNANNN
mmetsp:Transcript_15583/g.14115  ORF Transcript_15583/g.14115 Transcript_15583/m.14115 type:complete len:240 (+) Transcript_15583:40-759(+)